MINTKQRRAAKGGERGVNGEWYAGGTFIANTELSKMARPTGSSTGKQETAPFVWEVAPAGKRSLYRKISAFVQFDRDPADWKARTNMRMIDNDKALDYYRVDRDELQTLIDAWNNGERWINA